MKIAKIIKIEEESYTGNVYNIEVETNHNYFADGVLVSNCHEGSTPDGLHGDIMNLKFIETLLPYTELALGGGNPLTHPDLVPFLEKCKALKLIPSMTINQIHFMKPEYEELIDKLVSEKLIYGLGISLTRATDEFITRVKKYPNAVIHIINGVQPMSEVRKLYDHHLKVLILGYKMFRRGIEYFSEAVATTKNEYYAELGEMLKHFDVVSFDNLALNQLEVKRLLTDDEWNEFFMGDDGQMTCYIDCVNKMQEVLQLQLKIVENYWMTLNQCLSILEVLQER